MCLSQLLLICHKYEYFRHVPISVIMVLGIGMYISGMCLSQLLLIWNKYVYFRHVPISVIRVLGYWVQAW